MIEPTPMELGASAQPDEGELVARARTGDLRAFDALVGLRLMPTFRLARAILGSTEEAEDVTQEAFISAWRGLPGLIDAGRFDAWFTRIVVNACRMSMRRRPRAVVVSIESVSEGRPVVDEDGLLGHLIESDALSRAIDQLSVPERAILALYYLEDRSLADVASILGVPRGTAKWRLFQARAALRRAMAGGDEVPEGPPAMVGTVVGPSSQVASARPLP